MKRKRLGQAVLWILVFLLAAGLAALLVMQRRRSAPKEFMLAGAQFGKAPQIFVKQCATCHSPEGFGDGKAAYLVWPRPRDFSQGKFLLVTTDNRVPTDEDLFRTISRGMPGSAMPPWSHLAEQDRRDLVKYVRALGLRGKIQRLMGLKGGPEAASPMKKKTAEETARYLLEVGAPLQLPPEVPSSDTTLQQGRKVYLAYCAKCHGQEGRGDGQQKMEDDLGFRASPRDFTKGIFKGGVEARDLAYRILGGMPGSAMPNSEFKSPDELWAVVHYVRSLVKPGEQERVVQQRRTIAAKRIGSPPGDDPLAPFWDQVQPTYIALMPLWWRDERVEGVDVRAVHDGANLAIQLTWNDPTEDRDQSHFTTFGDGAALQFSADVDPPFFGMGDPAGLVNIWMWKAVWESDLVTRSAPQPIYPRAMMDFDMAVKKPGATTAANVPSKVADRDPNFYAAWGAGNLIANPHRPGSVENLNAKGLGTLHSQGLAGQIVRGKGAWKDRVWRVVFIRSLASRAKGDVDFRPGQSARVGFAVWDGQAGDRNGQKSVTIWHDLSFE
ncbi:MAG: c-type cytochrome [Acidobacteria bacterium]|nr:c-type cytochrome [Acidobacteriota bacterium]